MKNIKPLFLKIHRCLGLVSGLIVFVVATAGCLYVFEEEWREVFQHKYLHVDAVKENRLPITQLKEAVLKAYPEEKIKDVRLEEEKDAAFVFNTQKDLAISINPYTAEIVGARNMKKDFMSVVLRLHRELLLGKVGKQIVKWNVLIFFIMCVSGLILWWPKQKRFFKQAVTIKWKTKNWKRLNWDLHSVLGFYALFILFIISLTGIFWTFDTAKQFVSFATGSPVKDNPKVKSVPSVLQAENVLDSAYYYASSANPGAKQVFITVPKDQVEPIRVLMRYPYAIVRKQTSMFFDQYSLKLLHTDAYQKYSRYEYIGRSVYDFHTGRIRALGIGSKIIYFLAALFAASLPITGFMIWWGRNKKAKKTSSRVGVLKEVQEMAVSI